MNDRHPSAGPGPTVPAPDGSSYGHYSSYEQQGYAAGYDGHGTGQYETHPSGQWDTTSSWGSSGHTQVWDFSGVDTYGAGYDTGHYGTGLHNTGQHSTGQHGTSGQWDTSGWGHAQGESWGGGTGSWGTSGSYDTSGWAHSQDGSWGDGLNTGAYIPAQPQAGDTHDGGLHQAATQTWDTSAYAQEWDAAAHSGEWNTAGAGQTQIWDTGSYAANMTEPEAQAGPEVSPTPTLMTDLSGVDLPDGAAVAAAETCTMSVLAPEEDDEHDVTPASATASATPSTRAGRRRTAPAARAGYRPRRKALLTVAVPSVAVMGVAGIAAASVITTGDKGGEHTTTASAPDQAVKLSAANSKLDTQLAGLSKGADDFATRASRTQERIDLKARQDEDRKRKAEEAARKEAERPKFSLPVTQHGLSAYYGQAGVNWMSVHTGIDFPVAYGTPVMAATDGTVRTQYNVAYGNMAIVTAPDGTETWYCHLSSTKVRSGKVKAGDVIAYSGNSGNSTGPHLHFEVRPGGSAVDPLPWLRAHGLDPT
ncbi:M23 family metallopeptidase [Streptomyces sp. NPDC049577]|uniref:M23 family metallopeptidase n=1 Tax=Streptomyces sp. NPDC049577 TaxID=3155153 RepID=UPI00342ECD7B